MINETSDVFLDGQDANPLDLPNDPANVTDNIRNNNIKTTTDDNDKDLNDQRITDSVNAVSVDVADR